MTDSERRQIESEIDLVLPSDVVVLISDDGGGRDKSFAFYHWLFYSPTGVKLTADAVPRPSGDIPDMQVKDIREYIQSLIPEQIPRGKSASSLSWSNDVFTFRGDLLRTERGDYLSVQRFRTPK